MVAPEDNDAVQVTASGAICHPDSGSAAPLATAGRTLALVRTSPKPRVVERMVECYDLDASAGDPVIALAFRTDVEALVIRALPRCKTSLWIACYVYDGFYNTGIEQCSRRGVEDVKLVMDQNKLFVVGQVKMQVGLLGLLEWGAQIRYRVPGRGMLSAQHQKSC